MPALPTNRIANMTSSDLKRHQKIELNNLVPSETDAASASHGRCANELVIKKGELKGGGNIETDGECLDGILH